MNCLSLVRNMTYAKSALIRNCKYPSDRLGVLRRMIELMFDIYYDRLEMELDAKSKGVE